MFRLYESDGCHLCENAKQLLGATAVVLEGCELIDIAHDPMLIERFGHHIPVLEHSATQQLLYWPFDEVSLATWLSGLANQTNQAL
ncbi:glutaredoxin family protein [Neiella marina]|uniref:Glutaredoxin family protein n=1 Tax=Neiella holothuriorum TaxID=2870530 RepID=A0ABS7EDA4_9GAMM|nr:glutaredoxin family protein [Neiella holothuriorum]MBW8190322.1 glutaredoxin family protein [Neiella holothuriorum]